MWLYRSRGYKASFGEAYKLLTRENLAKQSLALRTHRTPAARLLACSPCSSRAPTPSSTIWQGGSRVKRVIGSIRANENAYYFLGYTELEQKHPDQARQAFTSF